MEPKDRELLEKVLLVSEENNRMVHRLYRSWWWGRIGKTFYWIVIIGIGFGSFYFLQPYIDKFREVIGGTSNQLDVVKKVSTAVVGN